MNASVKLPIWFRIAGAIFLLWNVIGIGFFYHQVTMTYEQMVEEMGKPGADCFRMMPPWQWWTYAIAVWGGTFASIALLLRKRWAIPLFLVSLVALVLQYGYSFAVLKIQSFLGWGAAGFPCFLILFAAFQLWFAMSAKKKGWIA